MTMEAIFWIGKSHFVFRSVKCGEPANPLFFEHEKPAGSPVFRPEDGFRKKAGKSAFDSY